MAMAALFLSVLWMLRDEKDKTRPLLVIAMVINFFYGTVLMYVMNKESGLVPWKYDYILFHLDQSLGVSAPKIAALLHPVGRLPLAVTYEVMVPMMILWFVVGRSHNVAKPLVLAYVAEMVAGPLLYAVVPGCGPRYAFGPAWLHPPAIAAEVVRLSGMPNAFPSLHMATALLFVLFARSKGWRSVALIFLAATAAGTISTGEHYVIDLVPGLIFGCFAACMAQRQWRTAALCAGLVLTWSFGVRLAYGTLLEHGAVLQALIVLTLITTAGIVIKEWLTAPAPQV